MARTKGVMGLSGSLGGITFYQVDGVTWAKQKSSIDAKRIKEDPAFERFRENSSEFGGAARMGKLLRDAAVRLYAPARGKKVMLRVNKLMLGLLKLDGTSARGKRGMGVIQYMPEALARLRGFDLSKGGSLKAVLGAGVQVETVSGKMSIDLNTQHDLRGPAGAHGACFSGCLVRIDFAQGVFAVEKTNQVEVGLGDGPVNVELEPGVVPVGTGSCCIWCGFILCRR